MNYRTKFKLASSLMLFLTLTSCGTSQSSSTENSASSAETTSVTETATVAQGAAVAKDSESPSGYTITFNYKADKENIKSVSVVGPFNYLDPNLDITDVSNAYSPHQYVNGMYASSYVPSKGMASGFNYTEQLTYDETTQSYQTSFPITSGSFAYSYVIEYEDGTTETIADPANPAPALSNASSNLETSEINKSVVYGHYDEENNQSRRIWILCCRQKMLRGPWNMLNTQAICHLTKTWVSILRVITMPIAPSLIKSSTSAMAGAVMRRIGSRWDTSITSWIIWMKILSL